jgi:hypothetical protein
VRISGFVNIGGKSAENEIGQSFALILPKIDPIDTYKKSRDHRRKEPHNFSFCSRSRIIIN